MKIGLVLSSTPAYSETFFNSKIKGLQENGYEVVLFVQNKEPSFQLCPVFVAPKVHKNIIRQFIAFIITAIKLLPHLPRVIQFLKLEKQENTSRTEMLKKVFLSAHILPHQLDWLHFGFATMSLGKELVAKSIGAKMAVSFRGFDINVFPLKNPTCYNLLWQQVDKVHSISNYLLQESYNLGLSKTTPYSIITPAVTIEKQVIPTNLIVEKKIIILTIARLHWIKGLDLAISAMKILKDKNIAFEYRIIGGGTNEYYERYQYQVYELGLQDCVFFEGKLSHAKTFELLQKSSIYLQPSINEGFCNALLEAQAFGKLCIATNVGGIPENIENNKTGWLINNFEASALASKIMEVLNLTEDEQQLVQFNAQQRVFQYFNIAQQQAAFKRFYSE